MLTLACLLATGCGGTSNVYSWKPQAASNPRPRSRPATRPVEPPSDQVGANLLEEAHRETKVTWVAVPSPDGKKTRWVQVK